MSKLCIIYSIAPRYREGIFKEIDNHFDCDWYFGRMANDIKEMDYSILNNVRFIEQKGNPSKLFWKCNIQLLFKKQYNTFLTLMESRAISDYFFVLLKAIFFHKKKLYIWTHGLYGKEGWLEATLKKWQFRHVDGIFIYSNYARDLMIKEGLPAEKIFTIHNSLHYDQQKALRESIEPSDIFKRHFGNECPTIIFIGRLTKVKKLDMILESLRILKEKGENYNLVFVGDGSERENLERKVESMGLRERVWFYGACYDEKQNAELIYNADLCVSPGNVGLTAMHALVFGCPVITHNCFKWQMPEFEAIQPGVTGDFFEMDNVEALTKCISQWFASKACLRKEVRKACFKEIDTQWNPYFQMEVIKKNLKFK